VSRLAMNLFFLCATAVAVIAGGPLPLAVAETITIQGSTTFVRSFEPYEHLIETISKHQVEFIPNKSMPGLLALLEGRADMAMISASLKSEIQGLRNISASLPYDQLQVHEIVNTRIAFAIHPSNPVRMASLDQVRKMLLGEIKNWEDMGGPNLPVRVVLVGGGGGVTTIIETKLLQGHRAAGLHVIYVKTPVQVIKVIQQLPGAIGFAQLALTKSQGLPELVTDQPVEQTLSLVTLGPPTPPMSDVIRASRLVAERTM